MAVPRQLLRPAQALTRVLIQTSFQPARSTITARLQTPTALPVTQIRTAVRTSLLKHGNKDPRAHLFVVDEQVGSIYINLVQDDGTFIPQQPLRDVLRDMDRISNFLLRVSTAQKDHEYPYPVCRIVPKEEVRNMEREKTKKKKTWDDLTKVVEINWSIAQNDLEHQMKRMTQFLEQGLRVEVVLGPKKRGRPATPEEIQATLAKVKETAASIPNVKEYAESEGEAGRVLSMYFSKPKELSKEKKAEAAAAAAAAPNKKAEVDDTSKGPKKVSRYKIKEDEKRRQEAEKAEAAKYAELLDSRATPSRQWGNEEKRESAYERDQRLLREDRQRRESPPRTQPPATPARRTLRADSAEFGAQRLGGRTGSLGSLSSFYDDKFSR